MRLYAYGAAVVALLAAFWGHGHYQKIQGRAEIQVKFNEYIEKQTTDTLNASIKNQEVSLLKQRAVDRSRQNDFENAKKLESANARLGGAVASLLNTNAALNNRAETGGSAEAVARANADAKLARDLLGECASRYQDMAGEAGELAAQVIGLQGFLNAAQP